MLFERNQYVLGRSNFQTTKTSKNFGNTYPMLLGSNDKAPIDGFWHPCRWWFWGWWIILLYQHLKPKGFHIVQAQKVYHDSSESSGRDVTVWPFSALGRNLLGGVTSTRTPKGEYITSLNCLNCYNCGNWLYKFKNMPVRTATVMSYSYWMHQRQPSIKYDYISNWKFTPCLEQVLWEIWWIMVNRKNWISSYISHI